MRNMEYSVVTTMGQKKSESPMGIEPITSRIPVGCSIRWSTRIPVVSKVIIWYHESESFSLIVASYKRKKRYSVLKKF